MIEHNKGLIFITLFIAILLTIIVLPSWLTWLRPHFVLLVLVYWALVLDFKVGVGIAWMMGILLDILGGTLLGEHALVLTLAIYVITKFQKQIRVCPISQQAIIIFCLSILYLGIIYWVQSMIGQTPKTILFWLPALSNALIWPWLFSWLRFARRKLEII